MATEIEITEWKEWVHKLLKDRENQISERFAKQLNQYLDWKDYRLVAYDLVRAAIWSEDTPSLSESELKEAQRFNELGFFGRRSIEFFRKLLDGQVELAAAKPAPLIPILSGVVGTAAAV